MTREPTDSDAAEPTGWDVVAKYLAGEADEAEAKAARAWLAAEPGRAEAVAALDQALGGLTPEPIAGVDVEAALLRVRERIDAEQVVSLDAARTARERRAFVRRTSAARIAAAVALVAGAVGVWWIGQQAETDPRPVVVAAASYATGVAEIDSIRLVDGTLVVLGPLSRLDVSAGYGDLTRALELDGIAAFDVVHDDARPFTVMAGGAQIRDLGTRFTVRTDSAAGVSVAVTEGSVAIAGGAAGAADTAVVLNAGELATVAAGETRVERNARLDAEVGWMERRLVFENAPLARVADGLRRWYGIELRIEDATLAEQGLTATFEGEPIDDVLRVIELALGRRIELRGDTAFVRSGPAR